MGSLAGFVSRTTHRRVDISEAHDEFDPYAGAVFGMLTK